MPYIISYVPAGTKERRYVAAKRSGGAEYHTTASRLNAKEYKTRAAAEAEAADFFWSEVGAFEVQVEERTTLAQETAKPEPRKPEPDDDSPLNQHARMRIAEIMEARGYTYKDVEVGSGARWDRQYVWNVLHGYKRLSRERMEEWARRLKVHPLELFKETKR